MGTSQTIQDQYLLPHYYFFLVRAILLQLVVLGRVRLLHFDTTDCRCADLHSVNTLLFLDDLPNLIVLSTRKNDSSTTVGTVPAVLTILVLQCNPVTAAKAPSIGGQGLIHGDDLNPCEVTHASMRTALLWLLSCLAKETVLVGVLAAILIDATAVEGAEDGVGSVVFCEVLFVLCELRLVVVEFTCGGVELRLGVRDSLRLRAVGVGVCEDAVLDQCDAEVAQLRVDPRADRLGQVVFELID